MEKLTKADFIQWKNDRMTKHLMSQLAEIRNQLKEVLRAPNTILGDQKIAARILGQQEGLEVVLNIDFEESTDEETTSASSDS